MIEDITRRQELAHFLRTRRERLSPGAFGLPDGTRRRTPGLRREELALVAGIGVTWYTRLEQGQDITPSPQVLESLARVFGLDAATRNHLYVLARCEQPVEAQPLAMTITPGLRTMLESMGSNPAYIANPRWDVIASNRAYDVLYPELAGLPPVQRNVPRFLLTDPRARKMFVAWERDVQNIVAMFRTSSGRYVNEPWYKQFLHELQQNSPEFRTWWSYHDIKLTCNDPKHINQMYAGHMVLQSAILQVVDAPDLHMVIYTPLAEENSVQKLADLLAREATPAASLAS